MTTFTLPRSTPEAQGVASKAILNYLDALAEKHFSIHSIMLLRHGNVIAEGWWQPYAPEHKRYVYSLSKSFTSSAVGFAVTEGLLSVEDKVISFFPDDLPEEVSENLAAMRIKDLLTMTTGHDEDATMGTVEKGGHNWAKGFLSLPVQHKPGTFFVYNSAATYMLSAIVQKVVPALIETGSYEHPWLGISGTTLSPDLAEAMGLDADQRGALVIDVTADSPADHAGLRGSDRQAEIEGQTVRVGGDVIVGVDDQAVKEFDDLITYLGRSTEVGQTIQLNVLRAGKEETVSLTLEARPKSEAQSSQPEDQTESGAYLGIVGLTVTSEVAQAMDLPAGQEGVLVEQVQQGSAADEAGLRGSFQPVTINGQRVLVGGDVIVAIDDQPVVGFQDLSAFLQQAEPDQEVTLTLLRDGSQVEVSVTLAARAG